MTEGQKTIKTLAITFGIILIAGILILLLFSVKAIYNFFSGERVVSDMENLEIAEIPSSLEIDLIATSLKINTSDKFEVQTNNKYVNYMVENGVLKISENKHVWFKTSDYNLQIFLPYDIKFENVYINAGAGTISVDNISSDDLVMDLGAGKVYINNINVNKKASINGGTGALTIKNGVINNLKFDLGVGKAEVTSRIDGNSSFDCGVGKLDLNLAGSINDYSIRASKGIGSIKIDNHNVKDDSITGNGKNKIDIDGGVGSIDVKFLSSDKIDLEKNFKVLNVVNNKNGYYLTIQDIDNVETVLLNDFDYDLEENSNYIFVFEADSYVSKDIKSLFSNYKLKDVKKTDQ